MSAGTNAHRMRETLLHVYAFHREVVARDHGGMLMVLATTPPPDPGTDPVHVTWWLAACDVAQSVDGGDFATAYDRYLDAYRDLLTAVAID